jgi:tripartite-type tricarboxylate transporter receptor subunit TctC
MGVSRLRSGARLRSRHCAIWRAAIVLAHLFSAPTAFAQNTWTYRDKTVTILVGTSAGGGYDFYGRLLARHIGKFLPGNPQVIVKNMPGAGGIVVANYLQSRAAKDGTEIGAFEHGTAFASLLSGTPVQFDPARLGWLGSLDQFVPIVAAWHTVPIYSADDLMARSMTVGSSGAGSTTSGYPNALNAIIGTKLKVVSGYAGSAEINLAIERGELDGVASWCWTCAKSEKPDWISGEKLRVVLQLAPVGDPELNAKGIPTVFERAHTDEQRQMLNMVFGSVVMSRPFAAPPDLPPDRLELLRNAFAQAATDPDLIADAQQKGFHLTYVPPKLLLSLIGSAYGADTALIKKVRNAYSGHP